MFMAANSGYAEVVSLLVSKGRARVDDREVRLHKSGYAHSWWSAI